MKATEAERHGHDTDKHCTGKQMSGQHQHSESNTSPSISITDRRRSATSQQQFQTSIALSPKHQKQATQLMGMFGQHVQSQALYSEANSLEEITATEPALQRAKIETSANTFQVIDDLNYLEAQETLIRMKYLNVKWRPEKLTERSSPLSRADISDELKAKKRPENNREYVSTYLSKLDSALYIKSLVQRYGTLDGQEKVTVDTALRPKAMTDVDTDANAALVLLNRLRNILFPAVQFNYEIKTSLSARFSELKGKINGIWIILGSTKNTDHDALYYLKEYTNLAATLSIDTGDEATKELIDLKAGVDQDLAFDRHWFPVLKGIVDASGFDNGTIRANSIYDCNAEGKTILSGLQHTTAVGTGGYNGKSVWGKISGGKVVVYTLAQHGATNRHYRRVSGTDDIPGNWRI